ncbi:MAG: type III-A CRISPR-associated protein Cas10/Csm1, partial [Nanoarchaeota archaeon]
MNKDLNKVVFSALLHDIGKIYYRITGENHTHATYEFLKTNLKTSSESKDMDNETIDRILNVIAKHHPKSNEELKTYIYEIFADNLSAAEREDFEENHQERNARNIPLLNPFDKEKSFVLYGLDEQKNFAKYFEKLIDEYYNSNIVNKEEALQLNKNKESNLKYFIKKVREIIKKIKEIDDENFIKEWLIILSELEKLSSFIPSSAYKSEATISLFDHLKNAAMFAYLLKSKFNFKEETLLKLKKEGKFKESNKTIGKLVVLDLSGIQNFIFSIYQKKRTVNFLKTRSLFLELLLFLLVMQFFHKNKIPPTQILLLTAGKAELLLTEKEAEELKKFIEEKNKQLFEKFRTSLFIAVADMDFKFKHIFDLKLFKEDFRKLEQKLTNEKLNKFKEEIKEWNNKIINNFGQYKKCEFCYNFFPEGLILDGEKINETEKYKEVFDNKNVCKYCYSFEKFGEKLRKLQKDLEKVGKNEGNKKVLFKNLLFDNNKELLEIFKDLVDEDFAEVIKELKINLDYYDLIDNEGINFPFSLHFPLKEENNKLIIKTTDELAIRKSENEEKQEEKLPLALVTLDVDNLGCVLYENDIEKCKSNEQTNESNKNNNEEKKKPQWSKIALKSRLLNYFFAYYIPYLIKNNEEYKNFIYLIFSGGDDNLFFGRADIVLKFLIEIRKKFKSLFGDKITFSASYIIFNPKENLRNVIEKAEELLSDAKNIDKEKNKLNLNGAILSWNQILRDVKINFIDKDAKNEELETILSNLVNQILGELKINKNNSEINYYKLLKIAKQLFQDGEGKLIYRLLYEINYLLKNAEGQDLIINFEPIIRLNL